MMNKHEFTESEIEYYSNLIKRLIERAKDDNQNVFTPIYLCCQIIDIVMQHADLSSKILIVCNVEFIVVIKLYLEANELDMSNVYFSSKSKIKRLVAVELGINCNHIFNYLLTETSKMKFDIIIGNPPYQSPNENTHNSALWPKFIGKAEALLEQNGILAYIVSSSWAGNSKESENNNCEVSASSVRKKVFSQGSLTVAAFGKIVNMHFNVGIDISYFIFQKGVFGKKTEILSDSGKIEIDYDSVGWIPPNINNDVISILNKTLWSSLPKLNLINNGKEITGWRPTSKIMNNKLENDFIYPVVNTSATYSKGIYFYSNIKHQFSDTKKVIFSDSGYARPFYDKGKFGLSHHSRAIEVSSNIEGENLVKFLNSKLIKFLVKCRPVSGLAVDFSIIIKQIPSIKNLEINSDEDIYNYFKLTEKEIQLIIGD